MQGSNFGARMRRGVLGTAVLAAVVFFALAGTAFAGRQRRDRDPGRWAAEGTPPPGTSYYTTIQSAVNASTPGTFILVEPGVYKEEVKVNEPHHDIYIRGMDRNTVILDGRNPRAGRVERHRNQEDNNVWIENMTVRNFEKNGDQRSRRKRDLVERWVGLEQSRRPRLVRPVPDRLRHGLDGGYGIFTNNEELGNWEHVYASGFNDSGLYIGACQECKAHVTDATIENNAVGYSGSNSGGELTIENSVFAHNSDGIVPNGENPGDGPRRRTASATRRTTRKNAETVPGLQDHEHRTLHDHSSQPVTENSNLTVPANDSTMQLLTGRAFSSPATMATQSKKTPSRTTRRTASWRSSTRTLPAAGNTIYFQLAGNRSRTTRSQATVTPVESYSGAILMQGGLFAPPGKKALSRMDCSSGNSLPAGNRCSRRLWKRRSTAATKRLRTRTTGGKLFCTCLKTRPSRNTNALRNRSRLRVNRPQCRTPAKGSRATRSANSTREHLNDSGAALGRRRVV